MNKKTYTSPTSQTICLHLQNNILMETSMNGRPDKWKEGENDWFSCEPMSDNSDKENYWK